MKDETIIIEIPKILAARIAESIGDDSQEAIGDFATIVLQNYLENSDDERQKPGDDIIEKRLKDLGYL
jgi:hypothetical protein